MVFHKQHFISNARLKLAKNQANASNTLRLNFCYLTIICILYPLSEAVFQRCSVKKVFLNILQKSR